MNFNIAYKGPGLLPGVSGGDPERLEVIYRFPSLSVGSNYGGGPWRPSRLKLPNSVSRPDVSGQQ